MRNGVAGPRSPRWSFLDHAQYRLPALLRDIFNIGTSNLASTITTARADARYEIFAGGRKLAELSRSRAELEGTQANEVQAHFAAALLIESNYYDVLSGRELLDVARAQLQRSQEGLAAARARVVSGAAVQTDSLQFILDRDQARVNVLRVEASLQVSRLQLGRRIGQPGGANAAALDTLPARELPYTLPQAVQLALDQGPALEDLRGPPSGPRRPRSAPGRRPTSRASCSPGTGPSSTPPGPRPACPGRRSPSA